MVKFMASARKVPHVMRLTQHTMETKSRRRRFHSTMYLRGIFQKRLMTHTTVERSPQARVQHSRGVQGAK